ncbi:MAG TPA: ferrochelatase [Gammaproteobacteria bacterium]|nr:ferrochelatase [Gammaproteobacteria bacterium]
MTYSTNSTGILLTNLGTPAAPTPKAVRHYLREFLSDTRIVELPRWQWWPLLYGLILPLRSRYSAALYKKIWTEHGSPLLYFARRQVQGLSANLKERGVDFPNIALGMRYGTPSIASALEQLREKGAEKIIALPLYPQYSAATTGSTFDCISRILRTWRFIPALHLINHYADNPHYIRALVCRIQDSWQQKAKGEKLLFSFHGIPARSVEQGDPYFEQCHKTARLVAAQLDIADDSWQVVFQSRFGRQKWLTPYCDVILKNLARERVRTVDVICPGFSADCLETLEEISLRNKEIFLAAGGLELNYIPALNDQPLHIQALAEIVMPHISPSLFPSPLVGEGKRPRII